MMKFITKFKYPHLFQSIQPSSPFKPITFSTKKESDADADEKQKQNEEKQNELNENDTKQINAYKVDKRWNKLLGIDENYNFQKELIVKKNSYERSRKELRESILFEDLLQSDIKIDIYNTKGKPFYKHLAIGFYIFCMMIGFYWSMEKSGQKNKKLKVFLNQTSEGKKFKMFMNCVIGFLFLRGISRHFMFTKSYVQRIIYDTKKENFTFTKRNILGMRKEKVFSRYKILYTENASLNRYGINYFDINTKEQFAIGYKYAWIKQDLFSHLIAQRIKL